WVQGAPVQWDRLYGDDRPRRVRLPTYPFARERYCLEIADSACDAAMVFEELWVESELTPQPITSSGCIVCVLSEESGRAIVRERMQQLSPGMDVEFVSPKHIEEELVALSREREQVQGLWYLECVADPENLTDIGAVVRVLQGMERSGLNCAR